MIDFIKEKRYIIAGIFLLWFFVLSHVMIVPSTITNRSELDKMTTKAITRNKSYVRFKTEIDPDSMDYETILDNALDKNMYAGCEFYEYYYTYDERSDGTYSVKLHIKKPRLYRRILAKHRIKEVAKRFENLSDYEKVKAVHDYIITKNHYVYQSGGAFEAVFMGHSECNGYALAFYAFMNELDIPVTYETGDNHMWNTVMLDGIWYNIDLTWDDPGDGSVHYDYFLKCDDEWGDHAYGNSTAKKSLPIEGKTAKEYCKMVPNYGLFTIIIIAAIVALTLFLVNLYVVKSKKKKAQQELLAQKLLDQNRQQMRQMKMLDEELRHMNDDY